MHMRNCGGMLPQRNQLGLLPEIPQRDVSGGMPGDDHPASSIQRCAGDLFFIRLTSRNRLPVRKIHNNLLAGTESDRQHRSRRVVCRSHHLVVRETGHDFAATRMPDPATTAFVKSRQEPVG